MPQKIIYKEGQMIRIILILTLLSIPITIGAQTPELHSYIESGLKNNLALKQKDISYRQSLEALREAHGMFLPSIGIEARYSRAGGGRAILFPIGDIMNPVYETLNGLLAEHGHPPGGFPHLENEVIPFLREEEQDTRIRLVQPVFEPSIFYNHKIKSNLSDSKKAERETFRRTLVADIRSGYFNYLKTVKLRGLLDDTLELLEENLSVSKSLFRNGKVTEDTVLRARAEISKLQQERTEAEKGMNMAASYFNFLLNRPLNEEIKLPSETPAIYKSPLTLDEASVNAVNNREELFQLESVIKASGNSVSMATSNYLPSIMLVLDYGVQGEEYRFTAEDDYWMGSVVFSWDLFSGFQKKAKRSQALLEKKRHEIQLEEVRNRIKLQVIEAWRNLDVAEKTIITAENRMSCSRKSFDIIRKKYRNGISSQIEFIDARTNMTSAEVNIILAEYDYFIKLFEFECIAPASNILYRTEKSQKRSDR